MECTLEIYNVPPHDFADKEYQLWQLLYCEIALIIGGTGGSMFSCCSLIQQNGRMIVIRSRWIHRVSRIISLASKGLVFLCVQVSIRLAVGYSLDEFHLTRNHWGATLHIWPHLDYDWCTNSRICIWKCPRWLSFNYGRWRVRKSCYRSHCTRVFFKKPFVVLRLGWLMRCNI